MYLIILESGDFYKMKSYTQEHLNQVDDGYADLINTFDMSYYLKGEWHYIEKYEAGE